MRRRISGYVIFLIVYLVIFVLLDFVIPSYFKNYSYYGGFFPLFFFFPFMFGRGIRSGRGNNGNSSDRNRNDNDILNGNFDSSAWEQRNRTEYDEFGIPVKKTPVRTWYYLGMVIILAVSLGILFYKGLIGF